jgi:uncharacterized protein YjiS (DUF1127 family)
MEDAMNDNPTLASHQASWPIASAAPAEASRRRFSVAAVRSTVATWRWRIGYRKELDEMWKANPYLVDDIGMTKWQLEAEIVKPFWRR